MEIHQLRYVCAIVDAGNFSRAAERCQIAQPSLSQQMLKLEDELGAKLFDRLGRGTELTEAGRAFLPHARAILEQIDIARASVSVAQEIRGSVSLGAIPTIAPYLIPRYTVEFSSLHPESRLRIVEDTTPVLVEGLRSLSIDFALLALPLKHKDLDLVPVRTEALLAALPKTHRLSSRRSVALGDLRGEPFVMLRDGHCFRDLSLQVCGSARVKPTVAFESGQFSSVLGMVAAGVGVTLVPEMAAERTAPCQFLPLRESSATRTVVLASLRGRNFNGVQRELALWIQAQSRKAKHDREQR